MKQPIHGEWTRRLRFVTAAALVTSLLVGVLTAPALAQNFDLVILGGRVMDPETKYDAIANVGIKKQDHCHHQE